VTQPSAPALDSERFQSQIQRIRARALRFEFPMLRFTDAPMDVDWNFALMFASAIAAQNDERSQDTVLRIATSCLAERDQTSVLQKQAAVALLERVGNNRAVGLAEDRDMLAPGVWASLPPLLRLEVIRSKLRLSIPLSDGTNFASNHFQNDLWDGAEANKWVSVSAPTSAGKSRILREWFLERLREGDDVTAVYIAPTRALVEEVSADFRRTTQKETGVVVMPWDPNLEKFRNRVLVLTQERLHLIQESHRPFPIDLMFVDEAQGLGSPERGILLQQVVDRAVKDAPAIQVIFASPLSANPDLLLTIRPEQTSAQAIISESVTVNQNLIRVEGVHRVPAKRVVSVVHNGSVVELGSFDLAQRATTVPMRLAYVAHAMGGEGGNIVYVNGADEAEKVARNIADLLDATPVGEEVVNLQSLIRTAVHPKYSLIDTLANGVAFHYGNMPLAIRAEVERLFGEGVIKYLVCTSTLLEGVNLPCRTIFMRNPQKGRGNPLSEADFWNLAGRAGRWGKEFQGNIVCIDTDDPDLWANLPTIRRRSTLQLATRQGLRDIDPLLAYVRSGSAVGTSTSAAENLFSYFAARVASGDSVSTLLETIVVPANRAEVETAIKSSLSEANFPLELIPRHSGISPVSIQRLLLHFREEDRDPHELVLPLPEEADARARYKEVFVTLGATMTTAFGLAPRGNQEDKRKWQLANLVVNWMKGMPLARLIEQRAAGDIAIAKAIRNVMADIETVARFQAPKYLACYSDVLAVYAAEKGIHDIGHGQDITMLLELGVSRPSEVVLMSLGLSRTATVALATYITVDNWTSEEGARWLSRQNLEGMDIPILIQREVQSLVATFD
jgi:hypothetical protein